MQRRITRLDTSANQTHESDWLYLPHDVYYILGQYYLSINDLISLALVCKQFYIIFKSNVIWRNFLKKEINLDYPADIEYKSVFTSLFEERERVVALVQCYLNYVRLPTEQYLPKTADAAQANVLHHLLLQLKKINYVTFHHDAKVMLGNCRNPHIVQEALTLRTLYKNIILAETNQTNEAIENLLDTRDRGFVNVHFSESKKINLLIKLMIACHAFHSLTILLAKLNSNINLKNEFFNHFGSTYVKDALDHQRPEILALLALHQPTILAKPLSETMLSFRSFYRKLTAHDRLVTHTNELSEIAYRIRMLCDAGANPDTCLIRRNHKSRQSPSLFSADTTISVREEAATLILNIKNDMRLDDEEKIMLQGILDYLINHDAAVPMQTESDNEDMFEDNEEPSPTKKLRSTESTPTKATGISRMSIQ